MGNPENTSNNKCVTLTYTVAKIYSRVLNNMFFKWSEKHETLTPNPFGFQRNTSTITAIIPPCKNMKHLILTNSYLCICAFFKSFRYNYIKIFNLV